MELYESYSQILIFWLYIGKVINSALAHQLFLVDP